MDVATRIAEIVNDKFLEVARKSYEIKGIMANVIEVTRMIEVQHANKFPVNVQFILSIHWGLSFNVLKSRYGNGS
jgi:hypothetical protein